MNSDGILHLENIEQYQNYLKKYRCNSLDELDETLWYNYGVALEISNEMQEKIKFFEKFPKEVTDIEKK